MPQTDFTDRYLSTDGSSSPAAILHTGFDDLPATHARLACAASPFMQMGFFFFFSTPLSLKTERAAEIGGFFANKMF